jgi:aspartate/methionine/tyrosine aminotransferase
LTCRGCLGYPDGVVRRFSARSEALEPFFAMEVMERAFAMEREGADVIHLEIGEPDFPPPPAAVDACATALAQGETHYTDSRGLPDLREAIARDRSRRFGVAVDPDRVIVTSGTSPAMLLVFSLLLDPGDEIVIGTPHYPCYPNFVRFCGGEPVLVATDPGDGYRLDPGAVAKALTPRTRAILVSSPANPTGAIQDEATLRALADLGPPLISDEIYDGIVDEGVRVPSAAQVSDDAYILDGFSKRYAMTGFRLGYAVVPSAAMRRLQVMQQNLFISANRFVQHAGLAALAEGASTLKRMTQAYTTRRRALADGLNALGLRVPSLPRGAFYVFADARDFGSDSLRLAFDLLERARVGVAPGIDFGDAGEGWLRFCCAASESDIDRALERLAPVLEDLRCG